MREADVQQQARDVVDYFVPSHIVKESDTTVDVLHVTVSGITSIPSRNMEFLQDYRVKQQDYHVSDTKTLSGLCACLKPHEAFAYTDHILQRHVARL